MKKILVVIAIIFSVIYCSFGQNYRILEDVDYNEYTATDGFFGETFTGSRLESSGWGTIQPALPRAHGYGDDQDAAPAPVGGGLLVLGLFGAGYAVMKRKKA